MLERSLDLLEDTTCVQLLLHNKQFLNFDLDSLEFPECEECLCYSQVAPWTTSEFILTRSMVGYSPWGHKESDKTERLRFHFRGF